MSLPASAPPTATRGPDAIRAFAGADAEAAHVAPQAQALLSRWNERVDHYQLTFSDEVVAE